MANVHIRFIEDEKGDVAAVLYYHHQCAADIGLKEETGWPAPEPVDNPVYCDWCGKRVHEVPLSMWGQRHYEP